MHDGAHLKVESGGIVELQNKALFVAGLVEVRSGGQIVKTATPSLTYLDFHSDGTGHMTVSDDGSLVDVLNFYMRAGSMNILDGAQMLVSDEAKIGVNGHATLTVDSAEVHALRQPNLVESVHFTQVYPESELVIENAGVFNNGGRMVIDGQTKVRKGGRLDNRSGLFVGTGHLSVQEQGVTQQREGMLAKYPAAFGQVANHNGYYVADAYRWFCRRTEWRRASLDRQARRRNGRYP